VRVPALAAAADAGAGQGSLPALLARIDMELRPEERE
jgi:hypothetical protein